MFCARGRMRRSFLGYVEFVPRTFHFSLLFFSSFTSSLLPLILRKWEILLWNTVAKVSRQVPTQYLTLHHILPQPSPSMNHPATDNKTYHTDCPPMDFLDLKRLWLLMNLSSIWSFYPRSPNFNTSLKEQTNCSESTIVRPRTSGTRASKPRQLPEFRRRDGRYMSQERWTDLLFGGRLVYRVSIPVASHRWIVHLKPK